MDRDLKFHSEKSYRGYKIRVYGLLVSSGPSVLDGTKTNYVAQVKDSLNPRADMESLPFATPIEAFNEAIDFIDELFSGEMDDLEDEQEEPKKP